jgi:YVTN family beta-propeller protein
MDDSSVRGLLEMALGEEPPIGPLARNSLRAGLKLRRRVRIRRTAGGAAAVIVVAAGIPAATGAFGDGPAGHSAQKLPTAPTGTAYVINSGGGTVTPIDLATNTAGKPIDVSGEPVAMAIAPDGKTAYVASGATNSGPEPTSAQTVTPIDLTTNTAAKPITLVDPANAIAIAPDGRTGYVINGFPSTTVTAIDLATRKVGKPVALGADPEQIAMAPGGKTVYITVVTGKKTANGGFLSFFEFATFNLATDKLENPVKLNNGSPDAVAVAPDGKTAYVVSQSSNSVAAVTPIDLTTNTAEKPIKIGTKPMPKGVFGQPLAIAISPNGTTAYLADAASSRVTPIDLATGSPGKPISIAGKPGADAIAISTNGAAAYVANQPSATVTPINLTTNAAGKPIKIGSGWISGFEAIVTSGP